MKHLILYFTNSDISFTFNGPGMLLPGYNNKNDQIILRN